MSDERTVLTTETIQHLRYALVGAYSIQIYDWIAMMRLEVKLIHRNRRWTHMKAAYILCRYYPLLICPIVMWSYIGNFTADQCKHMVQGVNALLTPFQFIAQGVMLVRAYAFTGRNPRILAVLLFFFFALIGVDIWVFCTHTAVPPKWYYDAVGKTGCFPDHGTGVMHLKIGFVKIAATMMDLVSLTAVLLHCRTAFYGRGRLSRFFVRQGLGAFIFITAINLGCAIFYYQPNSAYDRIGLPFVLVVPNMLACRVILQLRQKAHPSVTEICRENSIIVRRALARCNTEDSWTFNEGESDSEPGGFLKQSHHSQATAKTGSSSDRTLVDSPVIFARPAV